MTRPEPRVHPNRRYNLTGRSKIALVSAIVIVPIVFLVYLYLFPSGPILDEVANPVRDRELRDWATEENAIPSNDLRQLYFGDLHVHTKYSLDAYIGGTKLDPGDAYKFAKGYQVDINGRPLRIKRPLDFAAVTDHAEYLGEIFSIDHTQSKVSGAFLPRYLRAASRDTTTRRKLIRRLMKNFGSDPSHLSFFQGYETTKTIWDEELKAAESHYQPGRFTTFAAYEWTVNNGKAHNHRNIIFRDMRVPDYPVSALEARSEEDLWQTLDLFRSHGSTVMAIPHNSNLSEGSTFPLMRHDGSPLDEAYAKRRQFNEPIVEVHQAKGNSEVYAQFWENDEFADFENYNQGEPNINNFVRHTLKRGLELKSSLGTNPYKYGMIGSTDTHSGIPGSTEKGKNFVGHHSSADNDAYARIRTDWILDPKVKTYEVINPGGLVAVWANNNTRPAIYDALARKECYATSGGRIRVRFFGGYNFDNGQGDYSSMIREGYKKGVPMGGTLYPPAETTSGASGKSPEFIIWAAKDPEGANLDRIQVIKGWVKDGVAREKIFNAALSDGRQEDETGMVAPLKELVNLETGEVDPDKGEVQMFRIWQDPEFNPEEHAFYYLRVLEVSTPRYNLLDEIHYGVKYPDSLPKTVQERAWSSPIWYEPSFKK